MVSECHYCVAGFVMDIYLNLGIPLAEGVLQSREDCQLQCQVFYSRFLAASASGRPTLLSAVLIPARALSLPSGKEDMGITVDCTDSVRFNAYYPYLTQFHRYFSVLSFLKALSSPFSLFHH